MALKLGLIALIYIGIAHCYPSGAIAAPHTAPSQPSRRAAWRGHQVVSAQTFECGGAVIQVDFTAGDLDLSRKQILQWVQNAARAVTLYYGKFPVPRARVLIVPISGEQGIVQGTTWGGVGEFPGFTRIRLGQHTTEKDLSEDWTMTHELIHMAFPSVGDDQHWIEEGLATYVEPIARAQGGYLSLKQVWGGMLDGMPKGEPQPDDRGLDRTHTWGRTYWGGAMFCLVADVAIRQKTENRKGLQDALRAIAAAGGTINHEWSLSRALDIGDRATGTTVLIEMYRAWRDTPSPVDLNHLWNQLGIRSGGAGIVFNSTTPLAAIRESITTPVPLVSPK